VAGQREVKMEREEIKEEDARNYLIKLLREPHLLDPRSYHMLGYDVLLDPVVKHFIVTEKNINFNDRAKIIELTRDFSPHFLSAAWELCRQGILRPGVTQIGAQRSQEEGYSITPFGRKWLAESHLDDFVPTEPGRFAEMVEPFKEVFGPSFHQRAQEAIRCYSAHAYLACCAMCGAAAESILLSVAIKKTDNEKEVLQMYSQRRGRRSVENIVIGKAKQSVQTEFRGYTGLLKYWRDESAHGRVSRISENEAYTSLAQILRFALYVKDNWEELSS